MTQYTVQYVLPVDNPVNNVVRKTRKGVIHFEVPLNHPDAHNMTLLELFTAAERGEILKSSTTLNTDNTVDWKKKAV